MAAKTQAEQTYEAINRLMEGGMSMAEAVRKLATQQGKKENAVRGNYYNHRRKVEGTNRAPSRQSRATKTTSVDDAVAGAKRILEQALTAIDQEINNAKRDLDAAKARHDALMKSVNQRKSTLQRKVAAL
jgi:hypothetical protein